MKIRIVRHWSICLLFIILLLYSYFFEFLGFVIPQLGVFILMVMYFMLGWINKKHKIKHETKSPLLISYGLLFVVTIISAIVNGFMVAEYRDYLSFFYVPLFMLFFIRIINNPERIKDVLKLLTFAYWSNFVMFLLQQFVFGYAHQDNLAGMFGVTMGNDGFSNILLVLYTVYILVEYLSKRVSLKYVVAVIAVALYQAAVAEMKIYFVELLIIIFCLTLFSKFTRKKVILSISILIGVVVGVNILGKIYPTFSKFLSIGGVMEIIGNEKGYTSSGDINRLNGVGILLSYMNTPQVFLGKGIGNAAASSVFYQRYEFLHYHWFAYSYLFIELGIVGLITMLVGYCLEAIKNLRKSLSKSNNNKQITNWSLIAFICCIITLVLLIYNAKLFTITGAMLTALVLSLPYANWENK